jgi:LytS/YehU family sensor histidine kinase
MWKEIASSERDSPELAYNLGVCAEATGDLKGALQLYTQADRLLTQPNKAISAALSRVQSDQASRAKLKTQLQR